jgi:acyl carrier protein
MSEATILQKVREIVARKLNVEPGRVQAETRLAEDLGVDSFGALELMFEIEEAFELKIADDDIEHIRSVNDIVQHLATWLAKVPAS